MADETVTMEAIESHTYEGTCYDVGDTYELPAQYVDSVVAQGKAKRADGTTAKTAKAPKTPKAKPASKPVAPLTTHDLKTTEVRTKRTARLATPRKSGLVTRRK